MNSTAQSHLGQSQRSRSAGFTLVEMLVVIAIIGLLIALAVPMVGKTIQANRLTASGQSLQTLVSQCQQLASSSNCPVDMRFVKSEGLYRSVRMLKLPGRDLTSAEQIGQAFVIPSGITILADVKYSPLLTKSEGTATDYDFSAIRIYPDGMIKSLQGAGAESPVDPPLSESFFTLVEENKTADDSTGTFDNFYCIQIDPYTGRSRTYRP